VPAVQGDTEIPQDDKLSMSIPRIHLIQQPWFIQVVLLVLQWFEPLK
jgi:hypothetical protein